MELDFTNPNILASWCPIIFLPAEKHRFLVSLVVRISACHVEGPGSIPGRGGSFWWDHLEQQCCNKNPSSRIWTSDLWISDVLVSSTVHRSTNWAIEGVSLTDLLYIQLDPDEIYILCRDLWRYAVPTPSPCSYHKQGCANVFFFSTIHITGGVAQMVERSLSMREEPGSMAGRLQDSVLFLFPLTCSERSSLGAVPASGAHPCWFWYSKWGTAAQKENMCRKDIGKHAGKHGLNCGKIALLVQWYNACLPGSNPFNQRCQYS